MRSMVATIAAAAILFAVVLTHLDAVAAAYVDLKLEQSFGAEFLPAGTLKGDLDGQVCWPDLGRNAHEDAQRCTCCDIQRYWSIGSPRLVHHVVGLRRPRAAAHSVVSGRHTEVCAAGAR